MIAGYPGQNDAFLAMERGELDGYPSVFYSALSSTRPTWLAEKKAKPIVQYGAEKMKELGDVPFAPDLVPTTTSCCCRVASTPLALGRPLLMPPGVPADRVAAVRKALAETSPTRISLPTAPSSVSNSTRRAAARRFCRRSSALTRAHRRSSNGCGN